MALAVSRFLPCQEEASRGLSLVLLLRSAAVSRPTDTKQHQGQGAACPCPSVAKVTAGPLPHRSGVNSPRGRFWSGDQEAAAGPRGGCVLANKETLFCHTQAKAERTEQEEPLSPLDQGLSRCESTRG